MDVGQGTSRRRDNPPSLLIGTDNGEYLELGGFEHAALLARTGAKKTTSFVIPNAFNWPGSLVVLDIKGETERMTSGHRASRLGQKVFTFNPLAHDLRTHCWNPLDVIDRTSFTRFSQIMRQVQLMIPENPVTEGGNVEFWKNAARLSISSILWLLAEMPEQKLTYENAMIRFLRGDGLDWLINAIEQRRRQPGAHPFSERVVMGVSNYVGKRERLTEDVRYSITADLMTFLDPQIAAATSQSHFDLRNLRREPTTIYVTISPADIPRAKSILRLLFGSIINLNTDLTIEQDDGLDVPLLIILDEFARLGAMPELTSAAQFARGFGVRMAYVVQDKPQLQALYGHAGAADVFNNVGAEIIFGLGDIRVAEEYEKRLGNRTTGYDTANTARFWRWFNWRRMTLSQHLMGRPLKYAFEIVTMPEDEEIILRPNMRPTRAKRTPFFNDAHFASLVCEGPRPPKLDIDIKLDDGSIRLPPIVTYPNPWAAPPPWMQAKLIPSRSPGPPPDDTPSADQLSFSRVFLEPVD